MSTFPNFSNIAGYIQKTLKERKNNPLVNSSLNAWIKVTSGVKTKKGKGLVMYSNPNMDLFKAAGDEGPATIYGSSSQSGAIGRDWDKKAVIPENGVGLRPSPIIESMEVDEGAGNLSRKASFSIKCFSLEQMELVTEYFLEPGFTIFLEWGNNHPDSVGGITKSKASAIADHQNFKKLSAKRRLSKGTYDNYLGYITGGSTEVSGEVWTVSIKCTGFTELPAYLINGDNSGTHLSPEQIKENEKLVIERGKANEYYIRKISVSGTPAHIANRLNLKRWQMAYNALPSNRKTINIKDLEDKNCDDILQVPMAHAVNYINFDETVSGEMNKAGNGTMTSRFVAYVSDNFFTSGANSETTDSKGETKTETAKIPGGVSVIGEERFIRFGALMKIMNTIIAKSYKIGNLKVPLSINSSTSICSAYPNIFSTRKDKLFIPNSQSPKFDLVMASDSIKPLSILPVKPEDISVNHAGIKIQFPYPTPIVNGKFTYPNKKGEDAVASICYVEDTSSDSKDGGTKIKEPDVKEDAGIQKEANQWGLLDDLYVNFDFVYGILETSNLNVMEALYQILNGMSSAVNDLWDFQIIASQAPEASVTSVSENHSFHNITPGTTILTIIDANFSYKDTLPKPYEFNLIGTDSIFKEATFNMEMTGAKMNQIIGSRLNTKTNQTSQPSIGKLFTIGNEDLILSDIERRKPPKVNNENDKTTKDPPEDIDDIKDRMYAQFLGNLGTYPKVSTQYIDVTSGYNLNKLAYIAIYNDNILLQLAKSNAKAEVSPILPITFSFTISGVSGIKRGDKFKVIGIPKMYYETGFFQVIGISHSISGMNWNTTVEGAYRRLTT